MNQSAQVSFRVSTVRPATLPILETKLISALRAHFENGSTAAFLAKHGIQPTKPDKAKKDEPVVEACSDADSLVIQPSGYHPLIAAANAAFAEHRPLVLTPDAIWIVITQGLATHIKLNKAKYQSHFVSHKGKKTLRVDRDSFKIGSPANNWPGVFSEFSAQIKQHIGEQNHGLIVADFSTSGPVERAASEIVLMDAMQPYFEYLVSTLCGIPSVTLEGTLADWKSLHAKVKALSKFQDLEWWLDSVSIFTANCLSSYEGKADLRFWDSLYKEKDESGGDKANGWLIKLFPYIKDYQTNKITLKNPCLTNRSSLMDQGGITHDNLPGSLSVAPFIWNYLGVEHNYQFIAGIVGVEQNAQTLALRPKIGWAVRPTPESKPSKKK